jgi:hypothetical protein
MGAIFISYTGRDPEGDAWADRLGEVAIAVKDGKTVIPIQLGKTAEKRAVAVASAGEPGDPGA